MTLNIRTAQENETAVCVCVCLGGVGGGNCTDPHSTGEEPQLNAKKFAA